MAARTAAAFAKLRLLAKACALPLLAFVLISVATLAGVSLTGVTRISMPVTGTYEGVATRLPHDWLTVGDTGGACDGRGVVVSVEAAGRAALEPAIDRLQRALEGAGLQGCADLSYESNVVPADAAGAAGALYGWQWLLAMLIALAIVWALYVRHGLPQTPSGRVRTRLLVGVAGALVPFALAVVIGTFLPSAQADAGSPFSDHLRTVSIVLTLAVAFPMIEEIAFRAWLIPIASQAVGQTGAVLLSIVMFTGGHLLQDLAYGLILASAGLVFALVWLRTRSVAACSLAHGLYNLSVVLIP